MAIFGVAVLDTKKVTLTRTDGIKAATGNTSTFNFVSTTLAAGKYMAFTITGSGGTSNPGINSVTADGVACTQLVEATGVHSSEIWITNTPVTNASGTVTVVWDKSDMTICGLAAYSVEGASLTAYAAGSDVTPSTNDYSASVNVATGGAVLAVLHMNPSLTCTWAGLTEDLDGAVSGSNTLSTAFDEFAAPETGRTITATTSGTPSVGALCIVSFEPG